MQKKKIGILIGSLRKESFNRKIANHIKKNITKNIDFEEIKISELPFYNEDFENDNLPESYENFRKKIAALDGILFISPEYNRSVSAVIKNALDVGSRPYGKSVWNLKPAAIITSSIGAIGGFGANHHLRQSLVFLNMPCLAQPEAYIGNSSKLFDHEGKLINEDTDKFLNQFVTAFSDWIELFQK